MGRRRTLVPAVLVLLGASPATDALRAAAPRPSLRPRVAAAVKGGGAIAPPLLLPPLCLTSAAPATAPAARAGAACMGLAAWRGPWQRRAPLAYYTLFARKAA